MSIKWKKRRWLKNYITVLFVLFSWTIANIQPEPSSLLAQEPSRGLITGQEQPRLGDRTTDYGDADETANEESADEETTDDESADEEEEDENGDEAEADDGCNYLNRLLVGDRFTDRTGFQVQGWLEQGFTGNPANPADRFNGPVTTNDRANDYQLNQLYLIAARPSDPEAERLSFGFQAELVYGTDAVFFQSLGLDDDIVSDSSSRFYKLALPQLYAEVYSPRGPGITYQIGKWYALVGYETGLPTEDFFYSHTIGFLGTPYSNTGILASFDLGDQISTSHGIHRGSDVWEDNNNALSYTGAVSWTSQDRQTGLSFALNTGPEQDEGVDWKDLDGAPGTDAPGESLNRLIYSIVLEKQLRENLQYVISHDYFFQEGSTLFGIDNAEAYGVTQYLTHTINDRLSAGMRLEIYRDDDGFVASGCRSQNAASPSVYTNLTLGLQIQPQKCMVIRPEIRWDWQDLDDPLSTPAFDNGTSNNQFLFAMDAVLQF